jgi:protein-S-isoprenylcysteine O-methyltransferase Ste14
MLRESLAGGPKGGLYWITLASQAATAAFLGMQMVLVIVRLPTQRSAQGLIPVLVAFAAIASPAAIALLPKVAGPPALLVVSLALVTIGMAASTWVVAALGRSFSLLPQARGLVTSGPYALVRHPLYVAESVATLGVALQFRQPWALATFAVAVCLLLPRARFEEQVLSATFPEYRAYRKRTARAVPGLW